MGTEELLSVFRTTSTPALLLLARSSDYRVFEVNEAYLKYSFKQREQILGESLPDVLPPADGESWNKQELLNSLIRVKNEKTEHQMNATRFQVPRKEGRGFSVRYFAPKNIPILDSSQEVAFILHTLEEATLKDKAEHILGFSDSQLEALNYKSLFDQNPDTVFSMDPSGNFTSVNHAASTLTGYSREELMNMHFTHIADPSEFDKLEEYLSACLKGHPSSFEVTGYHANGQLLEVAVTIMPVVKDGDIDGIYGIVKDITEHKKLQKEKNLIAAIADTFSRAESLQHCLERTLEELCVFTESDAGELWLSSIDGREMGLTSLYLRSAHPDKERYSSIKDFRGLIGQAWGTGTITILHDLQTNQKFIRPGFAISNNLASGISFPIAFEGQIIAVFAFYSQSKQRIENFPHLSPNLLNQLAIHIQRKKAEQELNQYFMMSPDMIGFLSADGYFKKVNPAFSRVLGYSEEELLTTPFKDFIHPEDWEKTAAECGRLGQRQPTASFENRYVTRDGQVRWLSWTSTLLEQERIILAVARDVTERKFLEQTVDLQQRRFASLYKEAPVSMCILKGSDHVFESANSAYYELTARTSEITGKTAREVFPELEGEGYFDWLDQVYRTGKTFSHDETLLRVADGKGGIKEGYINFIYQPYYNLNGEIEGIFYFGVDVTREVLARKKIEDSERQYINLIQNLPAAVYTTDAAGRILLYNKAAVSIFGGEPEAGSTKWSPEVSLLGEDGTRMPFSASPMMRILQEGPSVTTDVEILIRSGDGKCRNVIVNSLKAHNSQNQLTGSINVLFDITERKLAEDELRKLSLVGTKTHNMVVITNSKGTIDWVNDAFCSFLGLPKEEILNKKPSALLYDSNPYYSTIPANSAVPIMENHHLMNRIFEEEIEYHSRENGDYWLELKGQPLLDATGQITHYFVIGLDVTEKKRSYEKLKKSKNEIKSFARQLNSVLEEERARIAREFHDEFGQLLTGLKMSLSSLKKRAPGETLSEDYIDPMLSDVDTIIQHIRRFATDLRPAILDTLGLLPSIEWLVQDFEKKTGIASELKLDVQKDLQLDKNLSICCFRICQEALTNVAKHAEATKVMVEVIQGEELTLKITDNGKGILSEKINDPLSMGLLGMRERAHLVGGELNIISIPALETTVLFSVKLFSSVNIF